MTRTDTLVPADIQSSEGRVVQLRGAASDVIISRRGGSKRMRFVLEVARDILEWNKSIGEKSK